MEQAISFGDLEDLNEWDGRAVAPAATVQTITGAVSVKAAARGHYKCSACNGTGVIRIYRRGGGYHQIPERRKCWKGCNGTGYTKTSPEQSAANRAKRAAKKMAAADAARLFLEGRPDVAAWFRRGEQRGNGFAMNLQNYLWKTGALSPKQLACIERDLATAAAPVAPVAAPAAQAPVAAPAGLDLRPLPDGYYAVPDGDTRLKVRVNRGKAGSRWADTIFVSDGGVYGQRQNYGRQTGAGPYRGKIEAQLAAILADPRAAMAAYGHLVGRCGVCNRMLEDEKSVAAGIGPVCAGRMGW